MDFARLVKAAGMEKLQRLCVRFISCEELGQFRDVYVILAGKTYFRAYCRHLKYTGPADFYSAVPILQDGFDKQDYFAYFTSLYRRRREGIFFGGVEIDLTKRCTLRCRECANLMQYYDLPERMPGGIILESVKRLLDASDGVAMVKILGGEPLLEQELLEKLLQLPQLVSQQKVLGIQIITNGTLLFREKLLKRMKANPLVGVLLSNYGALSAREEEIKEQLRAYGIPFAEIGEEDVWRRYGDPRRVYQTPGEAKKLFEKCKSKENCCTLLDGRLYACPRAAHGEALGFYPPKRGESVALMEEPWDAESMREKLKEFYFREEAVQACSCCTNMRGALIGRAQQM
ncbi:MAG: radical SAM protein [Eubacteriales bacterium]|nr:radical SAM protein [Eubacteriales bacterium]